MREGLIFYCISVFLIRQVEQDIELKFFQIPIRLTDRFNCSQTKFLAVILVLLVFFMRFFA